MDVSGEAHHGQVVLVNREQAAIDAGRPEWAALPASNKLALASEHTTYFTGKPCPKGHIAPRERGRGGHCKACCAIFNVSPINMRSIAKRRASELQATPDWLSREQLDDILVPYAEAKRLEALHGGKYHVDHIIPLTNPRVCGLHVPWNLQVLTEFDNCSKGNKFDPDEASSVYQFKNGVRV